MIKIFEFRVAPRGQWCIGTLLTAEDFPLNRGGMVCASDERCASELLGGKRDLRLEDLAVVSASIESESEAAIVFENTMAAVRATVPCRARIVGCTPPVRRDSEVMVYLTFGGAWNWHVNSRPTRLGDLPEWLSGPFLAIHAGKIWKEWHSFHQPDSALCSAGSEMFCDGETFFTVVDGKPWGEEGAVEVAMGDVCPGCLEACLPQPRYCNPGICLVTDPRTPVVKRVSPPEVPDDPFKATELAEAGVIPPPDWLGFDRRGENLLRIAIGAENLLAAGVA